MKTKKKCLGCKNTLVKVTDKDYPKLDYYFCNNIKCYRLGLLTVVFYEEK